MIMGTVIRLENEVKDSGIDWYGLMPANWEIKPIYASLDEINQKNNPIITTNILSLTNTDGVIPYSERGNQGNKSKENYEEYKVVYQNTIVANSMNILIGSVGLSMYEGCVSPVYYVYCAKSNVDIRYMNYLFQMEQFQKKLRQFANGILEIRLRVSSHDILHQKVAMPRLFEQQTIADYLDEKCSKIDNIIAEANASIEEYKELKQTVIFEAVTKGLDKNVEMKDSENLIIGKIPKHWNMAKVKNVATRITVGVVVTPASYFDDKGTVAFLRGINVKEYVINSEPMVYITEETNEELSKTIVHTNDLVIVRDGAIGVTAVVPKEYDGSNVVSMIIVSTIDEYNSDFLCYVLNSYVGKIQFDLTRIGSALSHTSVFTVSNIEIPKPCIDEQNEIVKQLKKQHEKLDSLIAEKESLIKDLESYKKSLIYEVVTGKRRVV